MAIILLVLKRDMLTSFCRIKKQKGLSAVVLHLVCISLEDQYCTSLSAFIMAVPSIVVKDCRRLAINVANIRPFSVNDAKRLPYGAIFPLHSTIFAILSELVSQKNMCA